MLCSMLPGDDGQSLKMVQTTIVSAGIGMVTLLNAFRR